MNIVEISRRLNLLTIAFLFLGIKNHVTYNNKIFSKLQLVWPYLVSLTMREKCPYLGLFWTVFFCIRNEYEEMRIYPVKSVTHSFCWREVINIFQTHIISMSRCHRHQKKKQKTTTTTTNQNSYLLIVLCKCYNHNPYQRKLSCLLKLHDLTLVASSLASILVPLTALTSNFDEQNPSWKRVINFFKISRNLNCENAIITLLTLS